MSRFVDGDIVGTYDGIVRIIWGHNGKTIVKVAMGDGNDSFLSLNMCLKEICYGGIGTVIVIIDSALEGKVYCYGNYGANWREYGSTVGYA